MKISIFQKKAQITIFILIGLILLIIFGFLFYLVNIRSQSESIINIEKITSDVLKPEVIEKYTTLCLDDALEQGLILIGKHGGYINVSENYLEFNDEKVHYSILAGSLAEQYNLPPIKTPFRDSIVKSLKGYIEKNTKECTNFSALEKIPELSNYEISDGTPEAEIRFAPEEVIVILTYPVNFTYPNAKPVKKFVRFVSKADVRFEKIYNAVEQLVEKEVYDPYFDIIEDKEESNNFLRISSDANIEKISIPEQASSLFIITDDASNIDNNPFVFRFARKNRLPILEAPEELIFDEDDYGDPQKVLLNITDPDEDELTLSVSSTNINWENLGWTFTSSLYSLTPYLDDIGSHTVTLTLTDPAGQKETQIIDIIVCASNNTNGTLCLEKCGASPNCNKKEVDLLLNCTFNEYLFDECNSSCQFVQSNTCGCDANNNCINHAPYSVVQNGFGWCYGNIGCENLCQNKPLSNINTFNKIGEGDKCGCISGYPCFPYPYDESIAEPRGEYYTTPYYCNQEDCIPRQN